MILLAQSMALVELDHFILGHGEIRPPAFDLDFGDEQRGAILVKVALYGPQHAAHPDRLLFIVFVGVGALDGFRQDGDATLPVPLHQRALDKDLGGPGRNIGPARIPLDDEIDLLSDQGRQRGDRIMSAVQPHQQGGIGQLPALVDRPQQEGGESSNKQNYTAVFLKALTRIIDLHKLYHLLKQTRFLVIHFNGPECVFRTR